MIGERITGLESRPVSNFQTMPSKPILPGASYLEGILRLIHLLRLNWWESDQREIYSAFFATNQTLLSNIWKIPSVSVPINSHKLLAEDTILKFSRRSNAKAGYAMQYRTRETKAGSNQPTQIEYTIVHTRAINVALLQSKSTNSWWRLVQLITLQVSLSIKYLC